MKTKMTTDARERAESYLRQVRASLASARGVEPEEVIDGVREHLERALADASEPVTRDVLEEVLDDLGEPRSWVENEAVGWRAVLNRLYRGPEDWRLAYLAFGTFLLGLAFGGTLWFLLLASFPLARAAVEVVLAAEGDLKGRRWLLYPPLLVFYAALAPGLLFWPVAAVHAGISPGGFLVGVIDVAASPSGLLATDTWLTAGPWAALGVGVWLILLGLTVRVWPRWIPAVFRPFAHWVRSVHLLVTGGIVGMASAGLLLF